MKISDVKPSRTLGPPSLNRPWMAFQARRRGGIGLERTGFHREKPGVAAVCDAKCDAISADRAESLVRAILLVAGMAIPESERAEVLARVVAEVGGTAPT
jgi:hypothetical protein